MGTGLHQIKSLQAEERDLKNALKDVGDALRVSLSKSDISYAEFKAGLKKKRKKAVVPSHARH